MAPYDFELSGVTVGSLPKKIANIDELASRIASPEGMLFNSEQRRGRAIAVLWMSLALALVDAGWELNVRPGQCFLSRDKMELAPARIVHELDSGKLSPEEWTNQCMAANIATLNITGETLRLSGA